MPDPKILLFDLETAPNLGYAWTKWDTHLLSIPRPWYILCAGYQWYGTGKTEILSLDQYPGKWDDDRLLVKDLHKLLDEADVVVAHNGDQFDIPKSNARMIIHGMKPPSPYKSVDTLKLARKEFSFTSNSLNDVCQVLGLGQKTPHTGFTLWEECMEGDPDAWALMKKYCMSDVDLLVALYERLRPWAPRHPNLATIAGAPKICPRCGSDAGMMVRKYRNNAVTRRVQYQCKNCGGYVTGRKIEKTETEYVL